MVGMIWRFAKREMWLAVLFAVLLTQSCAPSGTMTEYAKGSKEYAVAYPQMKPVVEDAIRGSIANLVSQQENPDSTRTTFVINREHIYSENELLQTERGEVRLVKLDAGRCRVEIDNPEYPLAVPEYQRTDYQHMIFTRIDNFLEKQSSS